MKGVHRSYGAGSNAFEEVQQRIEQSARPVYPLHMGGSVFTADLADEFHAALVTDPGALKYSYPAGHPMLRAAIVARMRRRHPSANITEAQLAVTPGSTAAVFAAIRALARPRAEVVVLSPHWLLMEGIIHLAGARMISVPVFHDHFSLTDLTSIVERVCNKRTVAIYFNHPNNPTGAMLTAEQVAGLVAICEDRGITLIADNAYEDFVFEHAPFPDALDVAKPHSSIVATYSVSKSFGLEGLRIGYLVARDRALLAAAVDAIRHTTFSTQTAGQIAVARLLNRFQDGSPFHEYCRAAWRIVCDELPVFTRSPSGGFYAFFQTRLQGRTCAAESFLESALQRGIACTPGRAFGPAFRDWARISYVSVPMDDLKQAVRSLRELMLGDDSQHARPASSGEVRSPSLKPTTTSLTEQVRASNRSRELRTDTQ